jgi:predicted NAD/FAD-binding protein
VTSELKLHSDTACSCTSSLPTLPYTLLEHAAQQHTAHYNTSQHNEQQVVFACHADTALALLGPSASAEESSVLGAFQFAPNTTYVHSDPALMPQRTAAWSAWNYLGGADVRADVTADVAAAVKPVYVTYWVSVCSSLVVVVTVDRQ